MKKSGQRGYSIWLHPSFFAINIILGMILSYHFVMINFSADNDVANSIIVWHEIQLHGFSVLSQWRPTVDNWYLSTYPIHFLLFKLTGSTSISIIKFIEISQVFLAAVISSLICFHKTRSRYAFLLIPFFCGLSVFAYSVAYISHPFSHNLTNLYGLACVYLYIVKPQQFSFPYEIGLCALIIIASVSDPWFQAAYFLPLFLTSLYSGFIARTQPKKYVIPLFITGIILFTHIIERLLHLPVARFTLGAPEQMLANAYWFLVGVGGSLNVFFIQTDNLKIISAIILILLYFYTLITMAKHDSLDRVIFLSLAGITSAFILSSVPGASYSARFFVNIVYLAIIAIFTSAVYRMHKPLLGFLGILFLSGIYSHWQVAANGQDRSMSELRAFLEKNDLSYGFGPYWDAKTLALAWDTQWKILIRPIDFDKVTGLMLRGGRSQTFNYWYIPETNDKPQRQFIAVAKGGEECPDLQLCLDGIVRQFGEPEEKLSFNNLLFYVYNRPIITYSAPELASAGELRFGWKHSDYIWQGWRKSSEPDYRWTEGLTARMAFHKAAPWRRGVFTLAASTNQPVKGAIYYRDKKIKDLDLPPGDQRIQFAIDNIDSDDGNIAIKIAFDALKSPRDLGTGREREKLGLAVNRISYQFD
ncbi:hypothetical protein ACL2XQ_16830 [Sodalis sp. RH14]|uniref:hypothetical protein n=1 Tax=Sodalis sp. RH14 TaxID=3394329 RepID=UPI0039B57631